MTSQEKNSFVNYTIAVNLYKNELFMNYAGKYFDYYFKNETDIIPAEESLCLDCNYPAPTQDFVMKFFREVCDIDIIINTERSQDKKIYRFFISESYKHLHKDIFYSSTYEEALNKAIEYLINK